MSWRRNEGTCGLVKQGRLDVSGLGYRRYPCQCIVGRIDRSEKGLNDVKAGLS